MSDLGSRQPEEDHSRELLFRSDPDYSIFKLDVDGLVSPWNSGAYVTAGYLADEIIGEHFSVVYPEEDLNSRKPYKRLEGAIEFGRSEIEGWGIRKDGSRFRASVAIEPIYEGPI